MTGCQSTSLPCVYIGQQSSTRLVALQECNPQGPSPPPPLLFPSPHLVFPSFVLLFPHPSSHFASVPFFRHFPSSPLLPLIIFPSAPPPLPRSQAPFLSFCHLSLLFSYPPFLSSKPPLPFSLAFLSPLFKIQRALSKLAPLSPVIIPSRSHFSPSLCPPSLIPLLSNPNKPGRTFLCGGRRRNTPHVRLFLNINISQFEVLEKDMRCLSST